MLKRKLLRDLWQNRTQFVSIFLMAFLGLCVFAGIDAESTGMGISADKYYEETNLADDWVVGASFSSDEVKKLEELPQIASVDRKLVLDGKARMGDGEEPSVEFNFIESMNSSFPYLIEGEAFSTDKEGVWLEELFARHWNLSVGDYIDFEYEGIRFSEQIKGIIIHPEYIFYTLESGSMMPTYGSYGYAYLSSQEYPVQDELYYNYLVIKQTDASEDAKEVLSFKELIKETINRQNITVLDREQNGGIEAIASEEEQHASMGIMFSTVFLLIAVMGIVTTMTRMTSNQRIQIGTLKALGFTKGRITWHYMSYGIVISALGSISGAIIGYLYLPLLFLPTMSAYYILPEWIKQISPKSYVAIALSILVSSVVSFLACRRELRDMPAITLKPAAPKNMKHTMLEKSRMWLSLNFATQWNFRDIMRNKARSLMGIAGVAGCTMLLLCAFGCSDCVKRISAWQYGELITGQYKVIFAQQLSNLEKRQYRQQYKGQLIQEGSCEFKTDTLVKKGSVTVFDAGNYLHFQNEAEEEITIPKQGVAMSVKMASLLGVEAGDFIEWHIVGEKNWERSRITLLYRTPTGQGITLSRAEYEKLHYDFTPTSMYTNISIPQYVKDSDDISGVTSVEQLGIELDENMETMDLMVGILIVAAVLLGIIVLYNMGVLSFLEKTREVATLKVLGFSSGKVRRILNQQNNWITIIGIILGLVLGYIFLNLMMQTMSEDIDIPTVIYPASYLYSVIGTWLTSTGVNYMLSGKVKTICMVDALKGVE